ncbi:phosphatase PAP2 family protein [Patescibacteria group bacterium]|nr:phosphatase PAP2 family protein [Patescibacteria group bacterium]
MSNTTLFFQIFNLNGKIWVLDQLMIFASTTLIYLVFLVVFLLALKGGIREKKAFLLIILGIPVAILLIKIIHLFINEPRPFVAFHLLPIVGEKIDASFPSRHATIISVIAFAYTYFKSKWALLFLLVMVWIGISRIFIGVHYPLDVLGGFASGAISILLGLQVKKILKLGFVKKPTSD